MIDQVALIPIAHTSVEVIDIYGGKQVVMRFANGYGVSVINHRGSYGTEMAVLHGFADDEQATVKRDPRYLCYRTPITSDVVKHIGTVEALRALIERVAGLAAAPDCDHDRDDDWWDDLDEDPLSYGLNALESMAKMAGG